MSRAVFTTLVILGALLLGLWLIVLQGEKPPQPAEDPLTPTVEEPTLLSETERASVEAYVRANISQLSPEPEVLGGTFYVTEITVREDGTGTVSYEDGHIALTAEFAFSIDELGQPHIDSFTVTE